MKRFGIERQALAVALIPVLILAVLLESAFLYFRLDEQEQILQDRAELIAQQLASSSEFAVFSANRSVLQQLTEGVLWQKDVIGVRLYDTEAKRSPWQGVRIGTMPLQDKRVRAVSGRTSNPCA